MGETEERYVLRWSVCLCVLLLILFVRCVCVGSSDRNFRVVVESKKKKVLSRLKDVVIVLFKLRNFEVSSMIETRKKES